MTLLTPKHNHAADECIAQIPQHHIPTQDEKVKASASFDKTVLVAAHMAALHDAYIMEMGTHPVNEVTIKPSSPTSSIGGLKPSTLKQLKVGKVHRRRVLKGSLCSRTLCTKTHSGLVVVNVFEDEEGNATPIYLSNAMEGNGGSAQAQRYYPQDSKVAVKEPYLTRLPDGEIVLLVERMTDLVFLWVPENVEEGQNTKGEEMCENVGEVFAMEKHGEEDEDLKSSSASRELIFEVEEVAKSPWSSRELKLDVVNGEEDSSLVALIQKSEEMVEARPEDGSDTSGATKSEGIDQGEELRKDDETAEITNNGNASLPEEDVKSLELTRELPPDNLNAKSVDESLDSQDDVKVEGDVPSDALDKSSRETDAVDQENKPEQESTADVGNANQGKVSSIDTYSSRGLDVEEILSMGKSEQGSSFKEEFHGHDKSLENESVNKEKPLKEGNVEGVEAKGESLKASNEEPLQVKHMQYADAGESVASLRIKGNLTFAKGEYNRAIDIYRRAADKAALENLKREEVLCLSNRAEVWLRLCRNQAALDDAEKALKLLRESEDDASTGDLALAKALFRKGRALMGLHKYEDAMRILQEVLGKAPADRHLREAALKCRDRLQHVLKPGKRQRAAINRRKSASFMVK